MASGGPPDIAESLGPAGRAAVDGAEDSFNQLAFNAFANQHPALVGALTRDHPQPALSHGDRAKLAWSRVSRRARESFAEDFMSHWLGAEPSTFELGPSESIDAAVSA